MMIELVLMTLEFLDRKEDFIGLCCWPGLFCFLTCVSWVEL